MATRNALFFIVAGALFLAMVAAIAASARAEDKSKATARDYGVTEKALDYSDPVEHGAFIYRQRCSVCHARDESGRTKYGPHLAGIFGRRAGATGWEKQSAALSDSGVVWDEDTLTGLVSTPQETVPGVNMNVVIRFKRSRKALIAYLKTL